MEITEEQRQRAEANRLAALAKRKAALEPESPATTTKPQDPWKLFKCRKPSSELTTTTTTTHFTKQQSPETISVDPFLKPHLPEMFRARLEICSPDSFSVTPVAVQGFVYPGEAECLRRLSDCLSNVVPSHYTQNHSGGKACVYKLRDYDAVLKCLKNSKSIELEGIPWGTLNVVERLSHSFVAGRWIPCRPEHLSHEKVDELIKNLPKKLLDALLPFQLDGLRFGLQRGGRCLIADEMGLGKTLQAIAIASCFINEGSILIVCPAILRFSWAEELERWLTFCLPVDIHLVFGHHDNPDYLMKFPRIVVISYTMLHHLRKSMLEREWAFLIVDESHHVRCTKKTSESEEIKAVLDVATKVKRIVLLSGTPSLSRPYDIFHQINMLWPGLLGKDKFEFAKTYCAVKSFWGSQGKIFQDFSKGIRLEELNVLLKQTVMIRRLKEHVLVQLPPKRRQIIRLLLKRSDIVSAKAAADVENSDAPEKKIIEDSPLEFFDEPDGSVGCLGSSIKLTYQELGIAKLTGFREWLSLHPIVAELDGAANLDRNPSSQKMIIFAHHHKVLDGVQEFICERGIGFVRIDGNSLPRDRQLAVLSFQSSAEVKIAIVGIEAGGVGLDFSAAQNVVFLELPKTPSWMLQAEDRAHRRGQTSAVNIYIFCAKDTLDESHWQNMNKSLHLVSSTTDGKYDAVQEIAVEGVSCLEMSSKTDRSVENRILEYAVCGELTAEPVKLPCASLAQDMHPVEVYNEVAEKVIDKFEKHSETCGNLTQTDDLNTKADVVSDLPVEKACVSMGELEGSAFEVKIGSHGRVSSFRLDEGSKEKGQEINPGTTKIDDGRPVQQIEADESCSDRVDFLRFEVSQYTGRIHLYSCIPGTDSRPRPLFENFRPEEIESLNSPDADNNRKTAFKFVRENPAFRHAILAFIDQWKNLRPIERRKLLRKPLQLPLTVELCYLNENINHNSEGLLRGGSNRRNTPLYEINHSLPSHAVWKKVHLCGGYGKKEKEYTQGWTLTDEPLCKLCQTPCRTDNAKTPEFFEDLFCNFGCYEEYRIRISNRFLRQELFQLEHGVCTNCHLDCHKLVKHLKPLSLPRRQDYIEKVAPKVARRKKLLDKLVNDPTEGNAWHADHIVPVYRGGGECRLENMRTLCVACHLDVTAAQCAERRSARVKAKKQLKVIMSKLKNGQNMEGDDANLMDQGHLEIQENLVEDELLIEVPGSAYSGGKSSSTGSEDLEKSTKAH